MNAPLRVPTRSLTWLMCFYLQILCFKYTRHVVDEDLERDCAHPVKLRTVTLRTLLFPGTDNSEQDTLRVVRKDDPKITRYLMWAHEDLTVLLVNSRRCRVNILDIEVGEPERHRRLAWIACHHGTDRNATIVEYPVSTGWPLVHGAVLNPTEEVGVERPR